MSVALFEDLRSIHHFLACRECLCNSSVAICLYNADSAHFLKHSQQRSAARIDRPRDNRSDFFLNSMSSLERIPRAGRDGER